jgi:5-methylcytosine-specific restriction endonuclease McrA
MTEARFPRPEKRARKPPRRIPRNARIRQHSLTRHSKLEKLADDIWALIVRSTAPVCVRCKTRATAQADHLVSRRYRATRWVISNGCPLCAGCHRLVTSDTHEHVRLAVQHVGAERWEQLNIAKHCGKVDPATVIVALRYEAEKRGLIAEALRRRLM